MREQRDGPRRRPIAELPVLPKLFAVVDHPLTERPRLALPLAPNADGTHFFP
jgi:hypothetical protein